MIYVLSYFLCLAMSLLAEESAAIPARTLWLSRPLGAPAPWALIFRPFWGSSKLSAGIAEESVSDRIDQALVFVEAGRMDLARSLFKELSSEFLTRDERAAILYNMATLQAMDGKLREAVSLYNQIETSNETLASCVIYNRALCLLRIAKEEDDLSSLKRAESTLQEIHTSTLVSPKMRREAFFAYSVVARESTELSFVTKLQSLSKYDLVKSFAAYLQGQFDLLLPLYGYEDVALYIDNFKDGNSFKVKAYIDRLVLFLEAPAKQDVAHLRAFFIEELLTLEDQFLQTDTLDVLLLVIYQMIEESSLILGKTENEDVQALLEIDLRVHHQTSVSSKEHKSFWEKLAIQAQNFTTKYLQAKEKAASDPIEKGLIKQLQDHLAKGQDPEHDLAFWQSLTTPVFKTYPKLFAHLDPIVLEGALMRLETYNAQAAKDFLLQATSAKNPIPFIIESWYSLYPRQALSFYTDWIQKQFENGQDMREELKVLLNKLMLLRPQGMPLQLVLDSLGKNPVGTLYWIKWYLSSEKPDALTMISKIDGALYYETLMPNLELQKAQIRRIDQMVSKSALDHLLQAKLHELFLKCLTGGDIPLLLEKAKELLTQSTALPEKALQKPAAESPLALQMQTKKIELHLSGETSIRLLQEMEREDAHLFEKQFIEPTGPKPW